MRDKINLSLAVIALLIWSGVLIYFYASGRIVHYLDERFRTFALIGGLGLAVVAVFNMTRLFSKQSASCGHDHSHDGHDHDHDHEHDHDDRTYLGNAVTFVLMVAPVLVAAKYSGDEYVSAATARNKAEAAIGSVGGEAFAAMRAQSGQPGETEPQPEPQIGGETPPTPAGEPGQPGQPPTQDTPPSPPEENATAAADAWEYTLDDLKKVVDTSPEGNLMLEVDQLFFTNGDQELQRVLLGQPVETTGQIILERDERNPNGNRLRIFRFMVTCCAADAQRVSIPIEFDGDVEIPDLENGEFREMSWVKISGVMAYPEEEGRANAVVRVRSIEKSEKPIDYLMF